MGSRRDGQTIRAEYQADASGGDNAAGPQTGTGAGRTASSRKAAVIARHRDEWARQREISDRAMATEDLELAKLAKLTAEMLKIRQESERKAWGIQDKAETEVSGEVVVTWER